MSPCKEDGRRDGADIEVDRVARLLMAEWHRVEQKEVSVSYIATFADMARVIVDDTRRQLFDLLRGQAETRDLARIACESRRAPDEET